MPAIYAKQTHMQNTICGAISKARRFEKYKFRRQRPIENYIVDFVCLSKRLIIEIDGGQHATQQNYDDKRTAFLQEKDIK